MRRSRATSFRPTASRRWARRCSTSSRCPISLGTGSQANIVNYFESASATHPRRNDVLRVDVNPTSKLSGYFRYINDHDDMISLYQGVQFSSDVGGTLGQAGIAPIDHPNPGHGYSGTVTYSISPTLINEFTVGESWNTWSYYTTDGGKSQDRSLIAQLRHRCSRFPPPLPRAHPPPTVISTFCRNSSSARSRAARR